MRGVRFDVGTYLRAKPGTQELLIELAARLGDDAAGLTRPVIKTYGKMTFVGYPSGETTSGENGYKFGRFIDQLDAGWKEMKQKEKPSADHFLRTFHFLARLNSRKADPRDEFELDWEWVAQHLCIPPYYPDFSNMEIEDSPKSCKEVAHEIRQSGTTFRPLLDVLDKFEQVALELEVYE